MFHEIWWLKIHGINVNVYLRLPLTNFNYWHSVRLDYVDSCFSRCQGYQSSNEGSETDEVEILDVIGIGVLNGKSVVDGDGALNGDDVVTPIPCLTHQANPVDEKTAIQNPSICLDGCDDAKPEFR